MICSGQQLFAVLYGRFGNDSFFQLRWRRRSSAIQSRLQHMCPHGKQFLRHLLHGVPQQSFLHYRSNRRFGHCHRNSSRCSGNCTVRIWWLVAIKCHLKLFSRRLRDFFQVILLHTWDSLRIESLREDSQTVEEYPNDRFLNTQKVM